eukprot:7175434-Alexandrium_andersonii.AAC.1
MCIRDRPIGRVGACGVPGPGGLHHQEPLRRALRGHHGGAGNRGGDDGGGLGQGPRAGSHAVAAAGSRRA